MDGTEDQDQYTGLNEFLFRELSLLFLNGYGHHISSRDAVYGNALASAQQYFNGFASEIEQKPSTSSCVADEESQCTKAIEVIIDAENELNEQPSTSSSSLVSSQPESHQDVRVYTRIRELRESGLWSSTRLPRCEEPPRKKTHWDFLLEEVKWLAVDFRNERRFKQRLAKQFAYNAKLMWKKSNEISRLNNVQREYVRDEKEAKRICNSISRMIRDFWTNVDKVVDFRANEIVESKKRRALDKHLNFLVGAADRITSIIHERLAESPTPSSKQSRRSPISLDAKSDNDEGHLTDEDDDESTIAREELHQTNCYEQEIGELSKEANMELDDLLTSLPNGYLDSLGYIIPENGRDDIDMESSQIESTDDDRIRAHQSENGHPGSDEKLDLNNVDYTKLTSDNSEVRRQQLDNIAEAALEFQPKGNTLETTEVKTEIPFLLRGQLREYQLVGLDWLVTLYEKNLNGILADEMGLGKTIQTIALLAHLACDRAVWGPHLIIVPTSVILNWEMELKKWCPGLKVLTYIGSAKERSEKRKGWSKSNAFHVCVTSYKLATQDIRAFKKKKWQYLILDEAQNIKNFKSQRWQTLLGLRSRRRLLLTGTPLQNSLMELWALLHFLMPNVFASHDDFKEWFHFPITEMVEGNSEIDLALIQRLHKVLRPFILRRLKSEVEKQLPTKTEKIIPCTLSKRQRYLYNEFLSKRSTVENLQSGNMLSVLGIIMQLRKCCNHPNLFEPRPVVSPLVVRPISPQFPSLTLFPCNRFQNYLLQLEFFFPAYTWSIFNELSASDRIQSHMKSAPGNESPLPFIQGLKFVIDCNGGHFFKSDLGELVRGPSEDICNGADHDSFHAINTITNIKRNPVKTVPVEGHNIFCKAINQIKETNERRDLENRQIGHWITKSKRICGTLMLPDEVFSSVNRIALSSSHYNEDELLLTKSQNSFTNQIWKDNLSKGLFEKANELISRNLMNWIEAALNKFLLSVQKVVMEHHSLISQHFNEEIREIHSLPFQNHLAHQAEIASNLEFPELRLIEYDCGKLQVLARLLERLYENRHRCLIFTQMSRMLDILQAFLSYHNYKYFRLDGATHIDQRQAMMERFNADDSIFCFILSTRSGGIGVNLTGADTVIFYDSDWNPTMDAQAQDRCHRIGQTRNVTIYRLISERTIEENILMKSMQKRRLGEMAIDEGEFTPTFFKSANNLRELFSNEETIADIIAPVRDEPENVKDIEAVMSRVEDKQDALAAQIVRDETKAEAAEFDDNVGTSQTNYDLRDIDSPSDQYLELIKGLKPVERYAVNFLANEYRPALDKEFEETEALIMAKQKRLMDHHEEFSEFVDQEMNSRNTSLDMEADMDIAYSVKSIEEQSAPFTSLETPFGDIPTWMPPSPPNSEAAHSPEWYTAMDGAHLYEQELISEDKLPPLPPLSILMPRKRQRSALNGVLQQKVEDGWSSSTAAEEGRPSRSPADEKEEAMKQLLAAEMAGPPSGAILLSPPGTPIGAAFPSAVEFAAEVGSISVVQQLPMARAAPLGLAEMGESPLPPTANVMEPTPMLSSLDEAIESTVRKSRKQTQGTQLLRHITRNMGQAPQKAEERTEASRVVFRLLGSEWRINPNALPMPGPGSQPLDFEGPPWNAFEDHWLLKALAVKHGLSDTEMLTRNQGLRLNWGFIASYVNVGSTHYRSPRQCALRYQTQILRCDEPVDEGMGRKGSAIRRRPIGPAPHSVVLDTQVCCQEAVSTFKRRANHLADSVQKRRMSWWTRTEQSSSGGAGPQQAQLLCFAGRLPQQHAEFFGTRYVNVMRPTDLLDQRRDRARKQTGGQPPPS